MSPFRSIFRAVRSWLRPRGGPKTTSQRRTTVTLEQLDHRQLLAVNFTGIVTTDFPGPQQGVVVLPSTPPPAGMDQIATPDADLAPLDTDLRLRDQRDPADL